MVIVDQQQAQPTSIAVLAATGTPAPLSAAGQRAWLETTAADIAMDLLGIDRLMAKQRSETAAANNNGDEKRSRGTNSNNNRIKRSAPIDAKTDETADGQQPEKKRRTGPSTAETTKSSASSEPIDDETMQNAITKFVGRLPPGPGAQLVVEDLLSYLRQTKPTRTAAMAWLAVPPFTKTLAAFGKLKNHPFLLSFDPWSGLPGVLSIVPDVDDVTEDQLAAVSNGVAAADSAAASLLDHRRQLEDLERELVATFNEEFRPTGMSCKKCGEQRFLNVSNEQRRSADEGSGTRISCGLCGHVSRSR